MLFKKFSFNAIYFTLSIISLIHPALNNGYPLVYSDSGAYIASGFDSKVPVDRPIMYSFFVRHISMAFSLWFVIVMQAIIVTTLLLITSNYFLKPKKLFLQTFIVIFILSFTTGISNYISQIMPDIFSAVVIIGLGILLINDNLPKPFKMILSILVVFSNMAHSSNLLTSTMIVFTVIFLILIFKDKLQIKAKNIYFILMLLAVSWLATPLLNYSLGAGFKVSRAPNVFIMGRLSQSGVLNEYLHDNCNAKKIQLCQYTDHLPASGSFLWAPESPLYDGGCRDAAGHHSQCWLVKNEEYKPVVKDIFTNFKYLEHYCAFAINETMTQLVSFKIDSLPPMMEGSPVMGNVQWRFKNESKQYIHSKQSKSPHSESIISFIQSIVISICTLYILISFFFKKLRERIPLDLKVFSLIFFLGIIFNAAICATFSMVANRFQGRVIWLLLLVTILILISQFQSKVKRTEFL